MIKANANRRYNSESISTARFIHWCEEAGVPYQRYSHRYDLPCGSTIGPIASAKLGIRSVDIGCPMWAMHSLRESAGVLDHDYMIRVLKQFFSDYPPLHCTAAGQDPARLSTRLHVRLIGHRLLPGHRFSILRF